jgi:tRNA(adenine34) deaminase
MTARAFTSEDEQHMRRALALARQAEQRGEVPVGAVLVSGGTVLGEGCNRVISSHDPTAHAEIEAIRAAATTMRNYRLPGTVLYVTLEPCVMCAGSLVIARVRRLVFAARDLRFGAVRSKFRLADSDLLNHSMQIDEGLLAADAGEMLASFFRDCRDKD